MGSKKSETNAGDLNRALAAFELEVRNLHAAWTIWRRLFHRRLDDHASAIDAVKTGDRAYRLTGAASKTVFALIRWNVLRAIVLDSYRLSDKPVTMRKKKNLTARRLLDMLPADGAGELLSLAKASVETAEARIQDNEKLQNIRHWTVAHADLETALGSRGELPFDEDDVEIGILALVEFVHAAKTIASGAYVPRDSPRFHADRSLEVEWISEADRVLNVLERGLPQGMGSGGPS